jgi:hypothetical protein
LCSRALKHPQPIKQLISYCDRRWIKEKPG